MPLASAHTGSMHHAEPLALNLDLATKPEPASQIWTLPQIQIRTRPLESAYGFDSEAIWPRKGCIHDAFHLNTWKHPAQQRQLAQDPSHVPDLRWVPFGYGGDAIRMDTYESPNLYDYTSFLNQLVRRKNI